MHFPLHQILSQQAIVAPNSLRPLSTYIMNEVWCSCQKLFFIELQGLAFVELFLVYHCRTPGTTMYQGSPTSSPRQWPGTLQKCIQESLRLTGHSPQSCRTKALSVVNVVTALREKRKINQENAKGWPEITFRIDNPFFVPFGFWHRNRGNHQPCSRR